jgi:hypothetical protein
MVRTDQPFELEIATETIPDQRIDRTDRTR